MSITNWFVYKYIRVQKDIPKKKETIEKVLNVIQVKYQRNASDKLSNIMLIDGKIKLIHGPYTCASTLEEYCANNHNLKIPHNTFMTIIKMMECSQTGFVSLPKGFRLDFKSI